MKPFSVIYSDDCLLVIDKSPGVVTEPADTHQDKTLAQYLAEEFNIKLDRGGIVHRLDKDTSGLLVVARVADSLEKLQQQFQLRTIHKEYLTLVHGILEKESTIEGAIGRNPGDREKFIVVDDGKYAKTVFKPIKKLTFKENLFDDVFSDYSKIQKRKLLILNYPLFTLVRCFPETGRTHQIRVHLKYINHPIVGDDKYAGRKTIRLDHRFCKRQFLHAACLEFMHPGTGKKMKFESPLPEDLTKTLEYLEPK